VQYQDRAQQFRAKRVEQTRQKLDLLVSMCNLVKHKGTNAKQHAKCKLSANRNAVLIVKEPEHF